METILKGLRDLEGVNGTFVADTSGQIYAFNAESIYDATLLAQVSKSIANAIDSVKLLQEDWETITAQFAEGRLLIRSVPTGTRKGGPAFTLSLVADSRLNPSFATVAIRVAIGKIKALVESNGGALPALGAAAGAVAPQLLSASSPAGFAASAATASAASHSAVAAPEVAASGLSWSGLGGSSTLSASGVAVADAASSAVLTACTKCLARAVGPMAKVFVKEAVRRVAAGQPFAKSMLPALVADLEKNIEDRADASEFQKAAMKLT
jgi:hypothetical protein